MFNVWSKIRAVYENKNRDYRALGSYFFKNLRLLPVPITEIVNTDCMRLSVVTVQGCKLCSKGFVHMANTTS